VADTADAESDEMLDDVSAVLDLAETTLRDGGWQLALQTGNAILGAKVLPGGDAGAAARAEARRAAMALVADLAARPGAQPDVHVNVCVHVDDAEVRDAMEIPGGKEITGGAITSIGTWAPQENVAGLHVSPTAAE